MNQTQHVLIIEDEPKIARILADFLHIEGFKTQMLDDGLHAIEVIKRDNPDFIILDLMLPNKDGLTICKEVRQFSHVPILMLTARVDEIDRLMGLGFGADDYVCKPFSAREVVARVKAVLRRTQLPPSTKQEKTLSYQHIELHLERFQCLVNQQPVELTPVEFRLLHALVNKPGVVLSRDKLMHSCYEDGRIVSYRTIDSHMKNLRNKLAASLSDKELLHSVYGIGYKIE
ncbi:MAG: response regulator [Paraglaciecola sp.]|uniref:response regulator n=1 Tax=Paraglaciecola sp. TaxID=1920173 RepID=UPI00273EF5E7|nr:response regulator [Paraglaciecola sp.]MDP5030380.1 response regulator [Paraglaciecola sp.]MDP5040851.1 response regulator [Paraglaciecola sp.]MDP5131793.1 response regulator [Paraglaciecola sp.]